MPDSTLKRRQFLLAALGTGATLLAGCGQGEYDLRMGGISGVLAKRGTAAPKSNNAQNPVPPNTLLDEYFSITDAGGAKQGLKLRLPVQFAGATKLSDGQAGAKLWFLTISGFCSTLQTQVADETGKSFPTSYHFYAINKLETPLEQLKQTILQSATAVDPTAKWVSSPNNGKPGFTPWHVLKVSRQFDFQVNGATENRKEHVFVELNEATRNNVLVCSQFEDKSSRASKLFEAQGFASESVMLED